MDTPTAQLDTLKDIKRIMERSSRFISLSGWSGICAGMAALIGAFVGWYRIHNYYTKEYSLTDRCTVCLRNDLIIIAVFVFIAAVITSLAFTYFKAKKEGLDFWSNSAKRLMWNTLMPMGVGGLILLHFMQEGYYELIAPFSLIFYGLALINGSKYTLGEVKYLGYAQVVTGLFNLFLYHNGLVCWAIGFGLFHIVYGITMWWKYERTQVFESKTAMQ